jgi:hypothetical protein
MHPPTSVFSPEGEHIMISFAIVLAQVAALSPWLENASTLELAVAFARSASRQVTISETLAK